MVSAKTGSGVADLRDYFACGNACGSVAVLMQRPRAICLRRWLGQKSPVERFMNSSTKICPYAIAVETEAWEHEPSRKKKVPDLLIIRQVLHVETESQKKIVVGKNGRTNRSPTHHRRKKP